MLIIHSTCCSWGLVGGGRGAGASDCAYGIAIEFGFFEACTCVLHECVCVEIEKEEKEK